MTCQGTGPSSWRESTLRRAAPDLPAELGVTKQAVSQVIDVLVTHGYLERHGDSGDRRRVVLALTDRGGRSWRR